MKNFISILGWVLFILLLFYKGCNKQEKIIVKIPKTVGSFKKDTIKITKVIKQKELVTKFKTCIDTVKVQMYEEATSLKDFSKTFEDNNIKIDINGVVQGDIKNIETKYITKEKEVVLQPKKYIYLGGNLSSDKTFYAGVGLVDKKENLYLVNFSIDKKISFGFYKKF